VGKEGERVFLKRDDGYQREKGLFLQVALPKKDPRSYELKQRGRGGKPEPN